MKKIILSVFISLSIFLLCACSLGNSNDPKETVKDFLDKYKNQDSDVISDLDETISSEYTGENKERYKNLMINQYKNMEYRITDEVVDGSTALVTAEITVFDYSSAIEEANDYLSEHQKEFYKDSKDETTEDDANNKVDDAKTSANNIIDNAKFLAYKLGLLEKVSDKKKYTIEFSLTKDKDDWKLDSLTDSDIEKLHGIYSE